MTTWNLEGTHTHLLICNGSSCMRKGGEEVTQAVRDEISVLGLDSKIHTTRTRCNGRCKDACVVIAYPQGNWYRADSPEIGREIVRDLQAPSLQEKTVYTMVEGVMQSNPKAEAIVGISKDKK